VQVAEESDTPRLLLSTQVEDRERVRQVVGDVERLAVRPGRKARRERVARLGELDRRALDRRAAAEVVGADLVVRAGRGVSVLAVRAEADAEEHGLGRAVGDRLRDGASGRVDGHQRLERDTVVAHKQRLAGRADGDPVRALSQCQLLAGRRYAPADRRDRRSVSLRTRVPARERREASADPDRGDDCGSGDPELSAAATSCTFYGSAGWRIA
jgi:hypothetical protein